MFKLIPISIILFITIFNLISADFDNTSTVFTPISIASIDEDNSKTKISTTTFISILEYPYMARISFVYDFSAIICGGILIHSRYVLTAKHCLEPGINHILVCMGSAFLPKVDDCEKHHQFAYRVVKHKKFDVMVLILVKEFITSPKIRPIDNYGFNSTMMKDYTSNCFVLGWGQTDPKKPLSQDLKSINLSNITMQLNDYQIYAYSNQGTAFANAGGPLVCETKVIGMEVTSSTTDPSLGNNWSVFLNLDKQREFINQVLIGDFDKSRILFGNKLLLLGCGVIFGLRLTGKEKVWIFLILLCFAFGKQEIIQTPKSFYKSNNKLYLNDENTKAPAENSSEKNSTLVLLFIYDAADEVVKLCTGSLISANWIISSGSCLKHATEECDLQVCYGSCAIGSTFATKIAFPRHEWYNNFAFVATDGSFGVNTTVEFTPEGETANLTNCKMSGFIEEGKLIELTVVVRRGCRVGYYCVDEITGVGCDLQLGSTLSCEDKVIGISTGYHPMTCRHLFDDDFDDEEETELLMQFDDDDYNDDDNDEDGQESHYALLFFIKFDSYEELITKVANDTFNSSEEEF